MPKSPRPPSCVHLSCSASLLSFGHHVHVSVVRFALHVLFRLSHRLPRRQRVVSLKTGVMFIPIGVGVIASSLAAPFFNKDYNRRAQEYRDRGELPPAELRLIPMMIGCWFVPAGLSPLPGLHTKDFRGPVRVSGFAVGFGFLLLYNPANNYIVDSYQHYAASALAAKTFVRSIWGACVPLHYPDVPQIRRRMGNLLMAFISLACCAIPYLFYIFGARIRTFSKYAYAPNMD